ncbi:alpha/beta fold hydrolase [Nonomuraea dietziae]|uniref:Pimeloyl-ACP methyl ester carboxylesterase n=1 Tax=Nonomuraea dietziae TaxID=65515 RepID=A0A7W5VRA7_9ACTN|nr:alpha/beta hydrolase [Nonomuraea dietziae]MBB3732992.1 pimeloyl-ACP methyl ester carboxylesterase [Nonomuraea dietziae]
MAVAEVEGVAAGYELHGPADGEPVLLLGGTSMPRGVWTMMQLPALVEAGYQVAAVDPRGTGESSAPLGGYAIADLAADAAGVMAHLGWAQARMMGLSQGGFVVEYLAAERPELVRSAVLLASAGPATAYQRAWFSAMRALFAAGPVPQEFFIAENLLNALPAEQLRDDDALVGQWVELLSGTTWDTPGDRGQHLAWIEWMLDVDHAARWPRIGVPVPVLALEHDLLFPPRGGRLAAAVMPQGRFPEIAGHAHGGAIAAGEQIGPAVLEFFAEH